MALNMAMLNVFVLALFLIGGTLTSNEFNEKTTCKNLKHEENFDVGRFRGVWYPIRLFDRTAGFPVEECMAFNFDLYENDNEVMLNTRIYGRSRKTKETEVVEENYLSAVAEDQAFFKNKTLANGRSLELCILTTDYDNYAIVSISNEENGNRDHLVATSIRLRPVEFANYNFTWLYNRIVKFIGNESAKTYEKLSYPENCPEFPQSRVPIEITKLGGNA